nr:MAG TPA: hypothetical protein [Caudoviricetes sp.]
MFAHAVKVVNPINFVGLLVLIKIVIHSLVLILLFIFYINCKVNINDNSGFLPTVVFIFVFGITYHNKQNNPLTGLYFAFSLKLALWLYYTTARYMGFLLVRQYSKGERLCTLFAQA